MSKANEFLGLRETEREALDHLQWFIENTLDQYFNEGPRGLANKIKADKIPDKLKPIFYEYEKSHKARPEILEMLK